MGLLQQTRGPEHSDTTVEARAIRCSLNPAPSLPSRPSPVFEGVALALALGMAATGPALAQQLTPNPNFDTLDVNTPQYNAEDFFDNFGSINNHSTLDNNADATLNNYSSLRNDNGATLNNNGYLYNYNALDNDAGATLNNNYFLANYSDATINNAGELNNQAPTGDYHYLRNYEDATINNLSGGTLNNNGILYNEGAMDNQGGGAPNSSVLNNSGYLSNEGTLTNRSGGTLNNQAGGLLYNTGALTNESGGVLNNNGQAYITNYYGTLTNHGTLNNTNVTGATYANLYNDAVLRNYGTLNNSGGAGGNTSFFNSYYGTVENKNTGKLNLYADDSVHGAVNEGIITNSGAVYIAQGASLTSDVVESDLSSSFNQTGGSTVVNGLLEAATIEFTGGSLSGTGALVSDNPIQIRVGVAVMPGASPGDFILLADTQFAGDLKIQIDGLGLGTYDRIVSTGFEFEFLDGATLSFDFSFSPTEGDMFDFLLADSILGFDPYNPNAPLPAISVLGLDPSFSYTFDDSTASVLTLTVIGTSGVPVPAPVALLAVGLVGLGWSRWYKDDMPFATNWSGQG